MDVTSWLDMWYTTYVESCHGLAPSTKAMYRRAKDAVPAWLGALPLDDQLLPLHLTRWLAQVAVEHPRAAQLDRVMLSRALRIAGKLGLCSRTVIDTDTVPKPVHEARKALIFDLAQSRAYMEAARSSDCYPLLMLCLCGLRRGEALGARWQDLDGAMLQIRRQRQRIDGAYSTRPLKSDHSQRALMLPAWLVADLAAWPRTITGWIVDTTPEHLQRAHKHVLAEAQLPPVTLHGLRHTFATQAATQGVAMKQLQVAMGHSKLQLTADLYADHLSPLSDLPALVWQAL